MTFIPLSPMTTTTCGGPAKLRNRASSSASVSPLSVYGYSLSTFPGAVPVPSSRTTYAAPAFAMAAPPPLPSHDQLSKSAGQRLISSHEFTFNPVSRNDPQMNYLPLAMGKCCDGESHVRNHDRLRGPGAAGVVLECAA